MIASELNPSASASELMIILCRRISRRELLDIVRGDVIASGEESMPAGGTDERDRRTRARAQLQHRCEVEPITCRITSCADNVDDIAP